MINKLLLVILLSLMPLNYAQADVHPKPRLGVICVDSLRKGPCRTVPIVAPPAYPHKG